MWEQDWALLGIEPTTERVAIKKAYALRLKVTRPDDDADAYQALRDAYERVQLWLKWQHEAPTPEAGGEPDSPTAVEPVALEAAAPEHVEAVEPAWDAAPLDAQALIDALHVTWHRGGAPALAEHWPQVRAQLDEQPLASRAALSAQFAQWVLRHPALPNALVVPLVAYFEWLGDFRVERQIGAELAQALHASLHERLALATPPSPEVQAQAQPLLQFKRLHEQRRHAWRLLLGFALQPVLAGLLPALGPRTLSQLGLDGDDQRDLRRLANEAFCCRLALVLAAAFAFFALRAAFVSDAVDGWTMWLVTAGALLGATHYLALFMNHGFSFARPGRPPAVLPLLQWRRHRWQPLLGLGLLALATVLGVLAESAGTLARTHIDSPHPRALAEWAVWMLPWVLSLIAALLAWPLAPVLGTLCVGVAAALTAMLCMKTGEDGIAWSACLSAALLYVLTGAALLEGRLPVRGLLAWICRPVTNTLTLGLGGGWWFGMLPTLLALAQAMSQGKQATVSGVVMTWLVATLALGFAQQRLERWALARLSRA